jgi:hypothetical protein
MPEPLSITVENFENMRWRIIGRKQGQSFKAIGYLVTDLKATCDAMNWN